LFLAIVHPSFLPAPRICADSFRFVGPFAHKDRLAKMPRKEETGAINGAAAVSTDALGGHGLPSTSTNDLTLRGELAMWTYAR
jgi:hypothetical protein